MKLSETNMNQKWEMFVKAVGYIAIMFYMIVALRDLVIIILNFGTLVTSSSMFSILLNCLLYLFVIALGVEATRKYQKYEYTILALVAILVIF